MCRHYALQLLTCELTSTAHIKRLKQLSYLQVQCLIPLLLMKLGDLPLDLLHDLNLALEELGERTDGIIA